MKKIEIHELTSKDNAITEALLKINELIDAVNILTEAPKPPQEESKPDETATIENERAWMKARAEEIRADERAQITKDLENSAWAKAFESQIRQSERGRIVKMIDEEIDMTVQSGARDGWMNALRFIKHNILSLK